MITREQVDAVLRMLAQPDRPSNRRISQLTGVGRQTVNRLASGTRAPYAREDRVAGSAEPSVPATRCPRCGGVRWERCVRCDAEAYARRVRPVNRASRNAPRDRRTEG